MVLPPVGDQLGHIVQALASFITLGLFVMLVADWYRMVTTRRFGRSPDGTIPHLIEHPSQGYLGAMPELIAVGAGLLGSLALYTLLGVIVSVGAGVSVLVTGTSIPVEALLDAAVAISVVYAVVLQDEIRVRVATSRWYLGYDTP